MARRAGVFISVVGKADTAQFDKARRDLDRLQKQAEISAGGTAVAWERAASRLDSVGSSLISAGKKMTLGMTLPLGLAGAAAFKMASDAAESTSKARVVFGRFAGDVERMASSAATSMGMSRQEFLEGASTLGNLFRAMEIGQPKATDMSTRLVKLAADLASFNNASPTDVLEALRSGLTGETEPLRRFGVNINEARIQAEAMALGLVKPTQNLTKITSAQVASEKAQVAYAKAVKKFGPDSLQARDAMAAMGRAQDLLAAATDGSIPPLTAAQKAQATYALILKDTKLAQGDFARTADGAANKQRIVTAQFKDAAAQIGTKLLPVGQRLLGWVSDLLDGFDGLSDGTQNLIIAGAVLAAAAGPITTVVGALSKGTAGLIRFGLGSYRTSVKVAHGLGRLRDGYRSSAAAQSAFSGKLGTLGGKLRSVSDALRTGAAGAGRWASGVGGRALGAVKSFGASIGKAAVVVVTQWVPAMASAAASTIAATWPILAVVAAVAVIVAAVVLLWKNWDRVWTWIKEHPALAGLIAVMFPIIGMIVGIVAAAKWLSANWRTIWDGIKAVIDRVWAAIRPVVQAGIEFVKGVIETVMGIVTLDWDRAWNGLKQVLGAVWDGMVALVQLQLQVLGALLSAAWEGIKAIAGAAWNGLTSMVSSALDTVVGFIRGLPGRIASLAGSVFSAALGIGQAIINGVGAGLSAVGGFAADLGEAVLRAFKRAANWVIDRMNDAIPNSIGFIDVPDNPIPRLHTGGVYRAGTPGGEGLAMLRDRERVLTSQQDRALASIFDRPLQLVGPSGGAGVSIGQLVVDARGATDPNAVEEAARRGVAAGLHEVVRERRRRAS